MIDKRKTSIIYQAYTSLATKGSELIDLLEDGDLYEEDTRHRASDLIRTGRVLFALQFEDRLSDAQINAYLYCLIRLARLNNFPAAPILFNIKRPSLSTDIIQGGKGDQGEQGLIGPPGSDADIDVANIPAFNNMEIIEIPLIEGVSPKTFQIAYNPYTAPALVTNIVGASIYEIGVLLPNVDITLTSTKGKNEILSLEITSDVALDALLQAQVDLPQLNDGGSQPVIYTVNKTNVITGFSVTGELKDDISTITKSDSISFVYPFLFGSNDNILTGSDLYVNLQKIIEVQGNKNILFNAANKFFYFAYPNIYPAIDTIIDGSGFIVNSDWEELAINVQSTGLNSNWTIAYRVYKIKIKTNITNQTYKFQF